MATSVTASILESIKKLLGIDSEYTAFDIDVVMHINTALMVLNQLGIGPAEGFSITDSDDTWADLLVTATNVDAVKSYIGLKVRLLFDPPTSSTVLDAINRQITELEWRLNAQVDDEPYIPPVPVEV